MSNRFGIIDWDLIGRKAFGSEVYSVTKHGVYIRHEEERRVTFYTHAELQAELARLEHEQA